MSGPLKIGKAHKAFRGFLPGRPPFIPTVMLCAILLLTLALTLACWSWEQRSKSKAAQKGNPPFLRQPPWRALLRKKKRRRTGDGRR